MGGICVVLCASVFSILRFPNFRVIFSGDGGKGEVGSLYSTGGCRIVWELIPKGSTH